MNSKYFVNRIVQMGIYHFELSKESKSRPYLVISKDDGGYGANILSFSITEQFTSSDINVPIMLGKSISFIRASATYEVPKEKIFNSTFYGLLRPDVFSIATRTFLKRFTDIDDIQLEKDLMVYLDELDRMKVPLYYDSRIIFSKEKFLNNEIKKIEKDGNAIASYQNYEDCGKSLSVEKDNRAIPHFQKENDMEHIVLNTFSLNQLIKFQKDMRTKSNRDLKHQFGLDEDTLIYVKQNIGKLIKEKNNKSGRGRNHYARNSKV